MGGGKLKRFITVFEAINICRFGVCKMIRNIQGFALMLLGIALILFEPVSELSILGLLLVFVGFLFAVFDWRDS